MFTLPSPTCGRILHRTPEGTYMYCPRPVAEGEAMCRTCQVEFEGKEMEIDDSL